jgi:hypothetical protein
MPTTMLESGDEVDQSLYVATDDTGVEHSAAGQVVWKLPVGGVGQATDLGHPLVLREPRALLDVLDERIYLAEPPTSVETGSDGTVSVPTAQLTAETKWNTAAATKFALDCADHLLGEVGDVSLPDGMSLAKVTADARQLLNGTASESMEHLGRLARLSALRRLRHEQTGITALSLKELDDADRKNMDAFDDPAYATAITVTDSVLAAIEALRHYVVPAAYINREDAKGNREQYGIEDRQTDIPAPTMIATGFGSIMLNAPHLLPYDPAWVSARESARHARSAMKDRKGVDGEASELTWQAATLGAIL